MLKTKPQENTIIPNSNNPEEVIEYINSVADECKLNTLTVDLSFMNIIDASYVSTMCSTRYFIKYPEGKINWKVSSDLVKDFNKNLSLGNDFYEN